TLQALDGERKGAPELGQKRQARAVMQPPVEAQHAEARTVVQGGVLKGPRPAPPSRTASSGGVPAFACAAAAAGRCHERPVESCPWPAGFRAHAAARAAYGKPRSPAPGEPGGSARWLRRAPAVAGAGDRKAPAPRRLRDASVFATDESSEH